MDSMKKSSLIIMVLFALTSCTHRYHPMDASKKAALVSEMINKSERCHYLKDKLASPTIDDDGVDDVYREATARQCIFRDV